MTLDLANPLTLSWVVALPSIGFWIGLYAGEKNEGFGDFAFMLGLGSSFITLCTWGYSLFIMAKPFI